MRSLRFLLALALLLPLALAASAQDADRRDGQQRVLLRPDGAAGSQVSFGDAVAFSADGRVAVVGAGQDDVGGVESGAAYVYLRDASGWTQIARLEPGSPQSGAGFGDAVATDADGSVIAVGAPSEDGRRGAVYMYTRIGNSVALDERVVAVDRTAGDDFGRSVALSDDGARLASGAPFYLCSADRSCGGVFVLGDESNGWTQKVVLTQSPQVADTNIGNTVAISGDGTTVLAGDSVELCETEADATCGYALVFVRNAGAWTQQAVLRPANEANLREGRFGASVALSFDGSTALVGAPGYGAVDDPNISVEELGRGIVFERVGMTWSQAALVASGEEGNLGGHLTLSRDGETMLLGATSEAFAFQKNGGTWTRTDAYRRPEDGGSVGAVGLADAAPGGPLALVGVPGFAAQFPTRDIADRAVIWQIEKETAIDVTAPSGRVVWQREAMVSAASWTSTHLIGFTDIVLVRAADSVAIATIREDAPASGSASWIVPADLAAGDYRVRARSVLDTTFAAFSPGLVQVQGAREGDLVRLEAIPAQDTDRLGISVALSSDAATLLGGAPVGFRDGRALVFGRTSADALKWGVGDSLRTATDRDDSFGQSVDLSPEGEWAVVGSPGGRCDDFSERCGTASIFVATADAGWTEVQFIDFPGPEPTGSTLDDPGDFFGATVAISSSGEVVAIGAPGTDEGGEDAGAIYLYEKTGGASFTLMTRLDGPAGAALGGALTLSDDGDIALSDDGTTLIASAKGLACPTNPASTCGGAIVYERSGGVWSEAARLPTGGTNGFGGFGRAVALSGDGQTAIVTNTGRGLAFERDASGWTAAGIVEGFDGIGFRDDFGASASLSADGRFAAVGAPFAEVDGLRHAGITIVFERQGSNWNERTRIAAFDPQEDGSFGHDVALSADAGLLLIGAPYGTAPDGGALYVAALDLRPSPTITVTAPNGGERYILGDDITVAWTSTDNDTVDIELIDAQSGDVVDTAAEDIADTGSFVWTTPEFFDGGSFRFRVTTQDPAIFDESDAAFTIVEPLPMGIVKLMASDGVSSAQDPYFGTAIALSDDGTVALVGAPGDASDAFGAGAAYILAKQNGDWAEVARLRVTDGDPVFSLGSAVALSSDGTIALVGAPGTRQALGATFVFVEAGGSWVFAERLEHDGGVSGDAFGSDVALSADGMVALIGAPNEARRGDGGSGAAYVFGTDGAAWGNDTPQVRFAEAVAGRQFGVGVALSADGTRALVAAGGEGGTGQAIFFDRDAGGWTSAASFSVPGIGTNAVALGGGGTVGLVGARNVGGGRGAAEVYMWDGGSWAFDERLEIAGAGDFDNVGAEVALSRDGRWAILSAPFADDSRGLAHTFERGAAGWTAADRLQPPGLQDFDEFGSDVAISGDGTEVLVGARNVDAGVGKRPTINRGAVFVYESAALPSDVALFDDDADDLVGMPYPNPAASGGLVRLTLRAGEAQSIRATLYDALGRRLGTILDATLAPGGSTVLAVPTVGLAAGVYLLRVEGDALSETRRFVVR